MCPIKTYFFSTCIMGSCRSKPLCEYWGIKQGVYGEKWGTLRLSHELPLAAFGYSSLWNPRWAPGEAWSWLSYPIVLLIAPVLFLFLQKKKILPGMYWMLHVNTDLQDLNVTDMIKFDVNKLSQHTHFWKCVVLSKCQKQSYNYHDRPSWTIRHLKIGLIGKWAWPELVGPLMYRRVNI